MNPNRIATTALLAADLVIGVKAVIVDDVLTRIVGGLCLTVFVAMMRDRDLP